MDKIQIRMKKYDTKYGNVDLSPKDMVKLLTREPLLIVRLPIL
jgi:hypothetical protein